jgi:hypothetical protein
MTITTKRKSKDLFSQKPKKHVQLIEKTYQSNTNSDYTERIEALGKNFHYQSNSDCYWGEPEFSMLYGTPLYQEASPSQKLALNHLYWVGQYNHTANSEANTILYNRVTTGVFSKIEGYERLAEELELETEQEYYHIKTFQRIGYKTKMALQGKEGLRNSLIKQKKSGARQWYEKLLNQKQSPVKTESSQPWQDSVLRSATKLMHLNQRLYYSQYLAEREHEPIPTTTGGIAGYTASSSAFKFLTLNWGSSPFMACNYYTMRMIANMSLKTYEHQYFKRYRELEKKGEYIPTPTAISYYHMLDESFHTTMSQTIAQEVYQDFGKPTVYEKFLANTIILRGQRGVLGGLSGWLPATFRDDASFMPSLYRLLQSPLFAMSSIEALEWMNKCLCTEHEGFHANVKHHQSLLTDFRRFFSRLDYLWSINREMRVMAEGGSINRSIRNNTEAFNQFSRSLAAEMN